MVKKTKSNHDGGSKKTPISMLTSGNSVDANATSICDNDNSSTDHSVVGEPINMGVKNVRQIMTCVKNGTTEMKDLVLNECNIIYECRVCRNLFRSLGNFVAHKRIYCKSHCCEKMLLYDSRCFKPPLEDVLANNENDKVQNSTNLSENLAETIPIDPSSGSNRPTSNNLIPVLSDDPKILIETKPIQSNSNAVFQMRKLVSDENRKQQPKSELISILSSPVLEPSLVVECDLTAAAATSSSIAKQDDPKNRVKRKRIESIVHSLSQNNANSSHTNNMEPNLNDIRSSESNSKPIERASYPATRSSMTTNAASQQPEFTYQCPHCSASCSYLSSAIRHLINQHKISKQQAKRQVSFMSHSASVKSASDDNNSNDSKVDCRFASDNSNPILKSGSNLIEIKDEPMFFSRRKSKYPRSSLSLHGDHNKGDNPNDCHRLEYESDLNTDDSVFPMSGTEVAVPEKRYATRHSRRKKCFYNCNSASCFYNKHFKNDSAHSNNNSSLNPPNEFSNDHHQYESDSKLANCQFNAPTIIKVNQSQNFIDNSTCNSLNGQPRISEQYLTNCDEESISSFQPEKLSNCDSKHEDGELSSSSELMTSGNVDHSSLDEVTNDDADVDDCANYDNDSLASSIGSEELAATNPTFNHQSRFDVPANVLHKMRRYVMIDASSSFQCSSCCSAEGADKSVQFESRIELEKHIASHHLKLILFSCSVCNCYTGLDRERMKSHLASLHSKPFSNQYYSAQYPSVPSEPHSSSHLSKKSSSCSHNKSANSKSESRVSKLRMNLSQSQCASSLSPLSASLSPQSADSNSSTTVTRSHQSRTTNSCFATKLSINTKTGEITQIGSLDSEDSVEATSSSTSTNATSAAASLPNQNSKDSKLKLHLRSFGSKKCYQIVDS